MVTPSDRRSAVGWLGETRRFSERHACRLVGLARTTCRYVSRRPRATELQSRLLHWAAERPRFGYRRLHVLLWREGWLVNHKRVYRLYCEAKLAVRRKTRKRVARGQRQPLLIPTSANERWSLDFMADTVARWERGELGMKGTTAQLLTLLVQNTKLTTWRKKR